MCQSDLLEFLQVFKNNESVPWKTAKKIISTYLWIFKSIYKELLIFELLYITYDKQRLSILARSYFTCHADPW